MITNNRATQYRETWDHTHITRESYDSFSSRHLRTRHLHVYGFPSNERTDQTTGGLLRRNMTSRSNIQEIWIKRSLRVCCRDVGAVLAVETSVLRSLSRCAYYARCIEMCVSSPSRFVWQAVAISIYLCASYHDLRVLQWRYNLSCCRRAASRQNAPALRIRRAAGQYSTSKKINAIRILHAPVIIYKHLGGNPDAHRTGLRLPT